MDNPLGNWKSPVVPAIRLPSFKPITTDFSALARDIREQRVEDLGFAHVMFERLMTQIKEFEKTLMPDEEVGAYLSSFGARVLIQIDQVGYHNPYFIVFNGINVDDGQRVRLVQHTSQISVLFTAMKVKEDQKPRRIGFFVDDEEDAAQREKNGG
jgi:hypothetical protein